MNPETRNGPGEPAAVDLAYFGNLRPEVAALVPEDAVRIVDVGCGAGILGSSLRERRPSREVRGVELDPRAAALAARAMDDVHTGSADEGPPSRWPAADCVVFADVLEHLGNPWSTLALWRDHVAPGGCIVASVPNVGHFWVIARLLQGTFPYSSQGILDRTHLRFFTVDGARALVESAGLRIDAFDRVLVLPSGALGRHLLGPVVRRALERERRGLPLARPLRRLLDLVTYQSIVRARVAAPAAGGEPPRP